MAIITRSKKVNSKQIEQIREFASWLKKNDISLMGMNDPQYPSKGYLGQIEKYLPTFKSEKKVPIGTLRFVAKCLGIKNAKTASALYDAICKADI